MCKREREIRVLFIYRSLAPFVERDLNFLRRQFDLKSMSIKSYRRHPFLIVKLMKEVLWSDLVFTWFVDTNALFAALFSKLLKKKSVVVVGGSGIANSPEIGYGALLNPLYALRAKFVLEHTDRVLPFSKFATAEVLSLTKKAKIKMIPLACDTEKFKPATHAKKEDVVLTVCIVKKSNITRKGLVTFLESASFLPKIKFLLVGPHTDDSIVNLKKIASSNVEFIGYALERDLISWYQKSKVYCQLSYQEGEGAGGALGEAMACECIPIVSMKATALKETVGDCGFYVPYGDAKATAESIELALNSPSKLGSTARERIKMMFSMERREKELLNSIVSI